MRPLSPDERWALDMLAGPGGSFDAKDGGEGTRLDAAMRPLIERDCVVWRRDGRGGIDAGISALGRLARRVDDAFRGTTA